MKKIKFLLLTVLMFVFSSCTQFVYVYEIEKDGVISNEELYVYEDSVLQIAYSFWDNHGRLCFLLTNKSDKPIYIDWKKSSFIKNGVTFSYWDDVEIRKLNGVVVSSRLNNASLENTLLPFNSLSVGSDYYSSVEYITKQERITFVPPKTSLIRDDYKIIRMNLRINQSNQKVIAKEDTYSKKSNVITENFTKENSPLIFRNFITYSYNEEFNEEIRVDNLFYLNRVKKMRKREFQTRPKLDNKSKEFISFYPYKNNRDFYCIEKKSY